MPYVTILIKQTKQYDFKPTLCQITADVIAKVLQCPKDTIQINIQEVDAKHYGTGGILECNNGTGHEEACCAMFVYLPICTLETKQIIGKEICESLNEAMRMVADIHLYTRFSFHDLPEEAYSVGGQIL